MKIEVIQEGKETRYILRSVDLNLPRDVFVHVYNVSETLGDASTEKFIADCVTQKVRSYLESQQKGPVDSKPFQIKNVDPSKIEAVRMPGEN